MIKLCFLTKLGKSGHSSADEAGRVAAPTPERVRSSDIERSSEVTPVQGNLRGASRDAFERK